MSALKYVPLCWLVLVLPAQAGDPTRPPFAEAAAPLQEAAATPLQLSMILREEGRRRAVINGQLLAVSESVGNARVVAIQDDHVVIAQGGRQFDLRMPIEQVKQTHQGEIHD